MKHDEILDKHNPTELDKLTCLILGAIERLHDKKIEVEDMKEIKKKVNEIWRKYYPLDSLNHGNQHKEEKDV